MSELKRTALRHRMLQSVVDGNVRRADDGWRGVGPISAGCLTGMQKAVGIVAVVGGATFPTDAARALLAEWNEQYGEIQL